MAQPVWLTAPGSLGVLAEGNYYATEVLAYNPDGTSPVVYELLAGETPQGMVVNSDGTITGVPAITDINTVTHTFAVRATTLDGLVTRLCDRTFSFTVTGQTLPLFNDFPGNLGYWYDGKPAEYQLNFSVQPLPANTQLRLIAGQLPPNLTINSQGLISGVIAPLGELPDVGIGYDETDFDMYPFDFGARAGNKVFNFTLLLTNGQEQQSREFSMYVICQASLTADNDEITADTEYITADVMPEYDPYITNYPENGNIGSFRHLNYFAYQIQTNDFDSTQVGVALFYPGTTTPYVLPDNLTLNPLTGWIYGDIASVGADEVTFGFDAVAYNVTDPNYKSEVYSYSLTIVGSIDTDVIWFDGINALDAHGTTTSLGTIINGGVSMFATPAYNAQGDEYLIRIKSGTYSRLPQGLTILSNGLISGRVAFNMFALDNNTTTFDNGATYFDRTFTFTVEAYNYEGTVSVTRTFSIIVDDKYLTPYQALYMQAMPSFDGRNIISDLTNNRQIMNPDLLYRANDPYFGSSINRVTYIHAYAMDTATMEEYYAALDLNHFRKPLTLGELKTAQALDDNGNVVYEVVYSEIVDTGVNSEGESPGQYVPVPYPFEYDAQPVHFVYPNSLIEMRNQMVDSIGQKADVLPLWMKSKQANGNVLGFVKCWVIAYVKPGRTGQFIYNYNQYFNNSLNNIDFMGDRYTLDKSLTYPWVATGPNEGEWLPTTITYFDDNATYFDGNGTYFATPAIEYGLTDSHNKYLVWPKYNILGGQP